MPETFTADRLNTDTGEWERVGEAETEAGAAALRPEDDWAEYRIRPKETGHA
jgi:hypothetical protein